MLESEDANIRIHAVKIVANLAAEGRKNLMLEDAILHFSIIFSSRIYKISMMQSCIFRSQ